MGECHFIPDNDTISRCWPRKEGEGAQAPSPRLPRTVDSIGWATRLWAEGKASLAPPGFVGSRSREFHPHPRARTKKRVSPLSGHGRIRYESGLELRGIFRGVTDTPGRCTLSLPSRGSRVRVPFPAPIVTRPRSGRAPTFFFCPSIQSRELRGEDRKNASTSLTPQASHRHSSPTAYGFC